MGLQMLRYVLTHLQGSEVSRQQAYDVESRCLEVRVRVCVCVCVCVCTSECVHLYV